MNNKLILSTLVATALLAPLSTQAHRAWILPAATVLSSDDPWVTFDAAISNDIFHTDYRPMGTDNLVALSPSGNEIDIQNASTGKYRSTFDLQLSERGTYKVFSASQGLSASWETEDGERRRWPGRGQSYSEAGFKANVPADARNLEVVQTSRRQETFVTAGIPDDTVLEPTGRGLELVPETHPNDLYSGETATFRFLIDGEPAAGTDIIVLAGGMRYRDGQDEITVQTDAKGFVDITWPSAGMYWLEASYEDKRAKAPATQRRGGYVATFEVLPQ